MLSAQFDDGGWNCRARNYPKTRHSSFHTTFNVLENLRIAAARGAVPKKASGRPRPGLEFMLAHRLFRSDRTGEVISERSRSYVSVALALHGAARPRLPAPDIRVSDERLTDAIDLLQERRKPNGRWPLQSAPGTLLVEMEKPGQESRWNTLRALRVLKQRGV